MSRGPLLRLMLALMKAIILAAGLGTRLRPITSTTPKCLVPINGVPLLELWLRDCERAGVEAVLVNTHYLAERVDGIRNARGDGGYFSKLNPATILSNRAIFRDSVTRLAARIPI